MKNIVAYTVILTTVFPVIFGSTAHSQQRLDFDFDQSCSYYGEKITEDVYSFNSTQEAKDIIGRIVSIVGLEQNFIINAANVPNAMATIKNNQRIILYSQNFILKIKNDTGTDWAGISILAHEIGHHLNGHTIMPGGSRPDIELQADKFSGFVCSKMGATLDQAQAAMNQIASSSGSSTHPPKGARLEAIAIGWNQGNSGSSPPPKDPVVTKPTVNENENVITKTSATIQIIYPGDNYGCSLPITITIGDKTFNPTGNSFQVSGIPYGPQQYTIQGQVNCLLIGNCQASGQGTIDIRENSIFYVRWQNTAYAQCTILLTDN